MTTRQLSGITLIELLVVMLILIILIKVGIPSFTSYLQQNRLIGSTNQLYYMLNYAKNQAIKSNTNVYVSFQTGDSWCYGINPTTTCSCSTANSCTLGAVSASSAGQLSLSASGLVSNSIRFEPIHGETQGASTLTFTTPDGSDISVQVTVMGNLRACSSEIEGFPAC